MDIPIQRLVQQKIAVPGACSPAGVVRWMGAIQAQDYPGGLWAIGLRTGQAAVGEVEAALASRQIIRTWPMRGTLHFVPAEDAGWMLNLLAPRVIARSMPRYRQLGLEESVFDRSRDIVTHLLEGGRRVTRKELYAAFERQGISTGDSRGLIILGRLAQEGLICFAGWERKQPDFALLEEWVPGGKRLDRNQALSALACRYFSSHGPATLQDFAWWSGVPVAEAQKGCQLAAGDLSQETQSGRTYWFSKEPAAQGDILQSAAILPAYDEYTVAYKDRSAVLRRIPQDDWPDSTLLLGPTLFIEGQLVGAWTRQVQQDHLHIIFRPLVKLNYAETQALEAEAERYGRFLGKPVAVTWAQTG